MRSKTFTHLNYVVMTPIDNTHNVKLVHAVVMIMKIKNYALSHKKIVVYYVHGRFVYSVFWSEGTIFR